ncbi:MAG TPA: hypothetical protein VGE64_03235 [Xanthomonadaceae bacterium]
MNKLFTATSTTSALALALALACPVGAARAEQVPQGVLVYYGSADFVGMSDPGVTVGPLSSPGACDDALDAAIENAVQNQGYVVESVSPCTPRWSFKGRLPAVDAAPYTFVVLAGSPGESLEVTRVLLKEVRTARDAYRVAEYEAVLTEIQRAAITDPLRKRDRPKK